MLGLTSACSRLIGDLVHALGAARSTSHHDTKPNATWKPQEPRLPVDDLMLRALTAVFGMENNGRIKKEKARQVVEKLGLVQGEEERTGFDLPGSGLLEDEVPVEEVLDGLENGSERNQLLLEAFRIFDEDGNGFIDAMELKRVLQCLGLDNGWDMSEIEKMLKVVDLNLDGKVDFTEFEVMMR
ncbi:hypothetical protein SLEP1_g45777 [Rubroshorea leprosula]|uniref:EF-hand domain-containing protein n=1 Tax=Rubroshorea leprosula TaxID=152421 RepID=A0AAV5LK30_9ROSI|nr:hypothetical protein SLEP1_g45777 [Rubroshorea leprosula]